MAPAAITEIDSARLTALIREVGRHDARLAVELQERAEANPVEAAAAASRFLARLGKTDRVPAYNPYDSSALVAMRFHAVAASGRKEGDGRMPDFHAIESGLQTLGVG